jgi:hypothetical protein
MIKNGFNCSGLIIFPLLISAVFAINCATSGPVSVYSIKMEIARVKKKIGNDRSYIQKLKDRRFSKGGFFYIIDNDGMVVFHPQTPMIGWNFKNDSLISVIIKEKSGCLRFTSNNQELYVFFDRLNAAEIICFSIASSSLTAPETGCTEIIQNFDTDNKEENPPIVESP